jgi:HPt (histidine-containing phosphotransfer) domain-containing protein
MSGEEGTLRRQFFTDAAEQLGEAEELVLYLESNGYDEDTLHSLFRLFHTLKGNSNMIGEHAINQLTHALESQLDKVRKGREALSDELIQRTFEAIDLLSAVSQAEDSSPYTEQLGNLTAIFTGEGQAAAGGSSERQSPARQQSSGAGQGAAGRQSSAGGQAFSRSQSSADGKGPAGRKPSGAGKSPDRSPHTADKPAQEEETARIRLDEEPPAAGAEADFEQWRPLLARFYRVKELAEAIRKGEGEADELLMELGMAGIELRSEAAELGASLERLCAYLEKFLATVSREQIPYNRISYELLFLLLDDLEGMIMRALREEGALREFTVTSLKEMEKLEEHVGASKALNIVEVALPEQQLFRAKHGLEQFSAVYNAAPGRVVFVNSGSGVYQKATALLDEMLEGFVRVSGSVEEGLYQLIRAEDSE